MTTAAMRRHSSRSGGLGVFLKAAIELSAIKLKDDSNASLKLPKGRKPKNEPIMSTSEAGGTSDIKSTDTPHS
jgi:hypothetical protein